MRALLCPLPHGLGLGKRLAVGRLTTWVRVKQNAKKHWQAGFQIILSFFSSCKQWRYSRKIRAGKETHSVLVGTWSKPLVTVIMPSLWMCTKQMHCWDCVTGYVFGFQYAWSFPFIYPPPSLPYKYVLKGYIVNYFFFRILEIQMCMFYNSLKRMKVHQLPRDSKKTSPCWQ